MSYTKSSNVYIGIERYYANMTSIYTPPLYSREVRTFGRTKTGNYLPKWRKIISSGGNATTAFDANIKWLDVDYANSYIKYRWRANALSPWEWKYSQESSWRLVVDINPIAGHFSLLTGPFFERARSQAIQQLYRQIWRAHHQIQGGVVLGELGKTAGMLRGTASNLRGGILSYLSKAVGIRNGRGSSKAKRKALSNTYLEATFGWQPLISDCKDLAKTLGRLIHESDRVRFRAFGSEEGQHSKAVGESTFGTLYVNQTTFEIAKVEVIYRGFLRGPRYEAGSPPLERIISMSGFDLRSFIPTVWELIPYSFLVDYFTNIGDVLQALCTDTSGVHGLWKTEIWESKREVTLAPNRKKTEDVLISVNGTNVSDFQHSGGVGKYVTTLRNVSRNTSGMPLMLPQFTGLDLKWRQFVNIGALFLSKMG